MKDEIELDDGRIRGKCDRCGAWVDIEDIYDMEDSYLCKYCKKDGW